ncbi:MAG: ABC transporter permease subunit [Rothia sp. (in: high G+C Gram-positive bacteria)]|nr:ABC transporter permease subunit [Rothia sp. (in: high G+C Gram-positive bacteria)]
MTSTTYAAASASTAPARQPRYADRKLSFLGMVRSEALKFRTLTTNWVMTGVIALVMVGLAAMYAAVINAMAEDAEMMAQAQEGMASSNAGIETVTNMAYALGSAGMDMANMLVASVAAVFIGSEYATRSIQTSMTVAPRRSALYLAKLLVLTVYGFVLGTLLACASFWAGYALLNSSIQDSIEVNQGLVLNWVAAGLYFVFMVWMGYGFGALLRNNAGGIVLVVVVFLILPIVAALFVTQYEWVADAFNYLPSGLGRVILTYDLSPDAEIGYLEGGTWFALWGAVPALLGWLRFTFTDAKG